MSTAVLPERAGRSPGWGPVAVVGFVVGLGAIYVFEPQTRYVVYGLGSLVALPFVPWAIRRAGSLERLLFVVLVLSVQLDVAVAFGFRPNKVAGPYGILISPILIAAIALLGSRTLRGGRPFRVDPRLVGGIAILLLAGALSCANASDPDLVAFGLFEILTVGLIAVAVADQCHTRDGLRLVQRLLAWTLVIQSILILGGVVTGVQISLSHGVRGDDYGWGASGRFAGTLNTPAVAATMLIVCLLSTLTRFCQQVSAGERLGLYAQLGLGGFALLLTQTRTGWVGFALGGAGVLQAAVRRGELRPRRLLTLAAVGVLDLLLAWPLIARRVQENHLEDLEVRQRLVDVAGEMIRAHPLLGIGLNTATQQLQEYAARAGVEGWLYIVHNQFVLAWAETGVLGVLALVWLFGVSMWVAGRLSASRDPDLRAHGRWLLWSLAMLVWALNLDFASGAATYKLVFLLFGVAVGVAGLGSRARTPEEGRLPVRPPPNGERTG